MSSYILIDTETTGLDHATSDVIEIGACVLTDRLTNKLHLAGPEFECRVRPTKPVDPAAVKVNGHDWALDPENAGWKSALSPSAAWSRFCNWVRGHYPKGWVVMVGWNASFDHRHLDALHTSVCGDWPFHFQVLDLLQVCRYLDIRAGRSRYSYKLDKLAMEFGGVKVEGRLHTALTDAKTALAVLERFEDMGVKRTSVIDAALDRVLGPVEPVVELPKAYATLPDPSRVGHRAKR